MRFTCAILFLALAQSANAQQQNSTITLSCNGTSKYTATSAAEMKPDPVTNLGVIVNATNRTVSFLDNVIPITTITATLVGFSSQYAKGRPTISGGIDRVTGSAEFDWMYENVGNNTHWDLTCRPATRLF
ncbi:hypothetical protein [Bradyrhizobium sp. WYCCWR 12699]|uniref:hypothetical protein n=1 Tax=Bradyrhizobium sp. WYCCWR 12699 TaxID=3064203 RepID=UPI0028A36131|nr:hypothetical protein [Bradyrhizobium sp. WYCCWR 12699]MDT4737075.1 hypothetical protein [Bradyrhizobium sp. WYCCWR 12699]